MNIEINGEVIEIDEDGYLLESNDFNARGIITLLEQQFKVNGHKDMTEADWNFMQYFRKYYENKSTKPTMH